MYAFDDGGQMKLSHLTLTLAVLCLFSTATLSQTSNSTSAQNSSVSKTKKKTFRPTKNQIKSAQQKLTKSGDYAGEVNGKYSKEFRAAIRAFQKSNSLSVNGKLDEATILKLGIDLTDRQKGIEKPKKPKRKVFRVSKQQISAAQTKLKAQGLYSGEVTGKYSKNFRTSIREFQSANGLRRKGSLNRATLEKLGIELTEAQKAMPVNPNDLASGKSKKRGPVFRATKDQIREVQKMLSTKKLYAGDETGKLNKETRTAIKSWQKSNGIKVTGTLNKVTLEAMGIALTEKQKKS